MKKNKNSVELENKQATRFDVFDELDDFIVEPMTETPEGFLTGVAKVTNVGIFNYRDIGGNILKELRPPEEVFNYDSARTLEMKPLTNNHPTEQVTSENAKDLTVGYTGKGHRRDDYSLSVPITITDKKTIDEVRQGKVALSCGYTAELELKSGYAFGNNQYDAIQRNIRYNHIAIVDVGRAGDTAKLKLRNDSDAILVKDTAGREEREKELETKEKDIKKGSMGIEAIADDSTCHLDIKGGYTNMKKIILDNVEYQAEQEVINRLNASNKDNDQKQGKIAELEKKISDKEAELSKLQADHDTLADELKKKQFTSDDLNKLVAERLSVLSVADKLSLKHGDGDDLKEIKKAIIKSQYETAQLDDKDDVYIDARYDAVKESIDAIVAKKNKEKNDKTILGAGSTTANGDSDELSAREKYCIEIEKQYESYKGA